MPPSARTNNSINNHVVMETENDGLLSRVRPSRAQQAQDRRYHRKSMVWTTLGVVVVIVMGILSATLYHVGLRQQDANYLWNGGDDDNDDETFDYAYYGRPRLKHRYTRLHPRGQMQALNSLKVSSDVQPGCEATIMIVRHCEKKGPNAVDDSSGIITRSGRHHKKKTKEGSEDQHCSYLGFERAMYLATLYGTRWPLPSMLYALNSTRHDHVNWREVETLQPLAEKTNSVIDSRFDKKQAPDLATDIYAHLATKGDLCGRVIVICWKHSEIPYLARALGCSTCPDVYPKTSFDQVWELRYVYGAPKLYTEGNPTQHPVRWNLYSNLVTQNFDPLAHSHAAGDYPSGGTPTGGRWAGNADTDPFGEDREADANVAATADKEP